MSLQFIECPYCKCPMTCMQTMLFHISKRCQTEEHKAKQAEYDAGIIHPWDEKIIKIPVSKLVLNKKLLQ